MPRTAQIWRMCQWPAMVRLPAPPDASGAGRGHVPRSAAGYVPDPPPIAPQPARVLGLYPPEWMTSAHRAKRRRNTAVGGAQHGGRMIEKICVVFLQVLVSSLKPPSEPRRPTFSGIWLTRILCGPRVGQLFTTTNCIEISVFGLLQAGWQVLCLYVGGASESRSQI